MAPSFTPNATEAGGAGSSSAPRRRPRFSAQERSRRRNHGLLGHVTTLLLQPRLFFYTLPQSRHWLLIAIVSLFVVGYTAVQEQTMAGAGGIAAPIDMGIPPEMGVPFEMGDDPFAVPLPADPGMGGMPAAPGGDTTSNVTVGVRAASMLVAIWLAQSVLLLVVPLFNGQPPSLGRGLQIAVWVSVPLVIMLVVQMLYRNAGGTGESPGLSALLHEWDMYQMQSADVQWVIMSALSQVTLWRLWALGLLYFGARDALRGQRLPALFVVVLWAGIAVIVPVMLGMTPLPAAVAPPAPLEMPFPMPEMSGMEGIDAATMEPAAPFAPADAAQGG